MKLGVCYMLFDGEELLPFAINSIRDQVDYISVTYQTKSYFGNTTFDLYSYLKSLDIDEVIYYEPDLSLLPRENELILRNMGLDASCRAGCTHHISSDVDEFYRSDQLCYAKGMMDGYDFSIVNYVNYYKDPQFLVFPSQNLRVSFIHSVQSRYCFNLDFPFLIDHTRRFGNSDRFIEFASDDVLMHHMSYVRRDIRKKLANSSNGKLFNVDKFMVNFDSYEVGGRVCLLPDFKNRRTVKVDNIFGISI